MFQRFVFALGFWMACSPVRAEVRCHALPPPAKISQELRLYLQTRESTPISLVIQIRQKSLKKVRELISKFYIQHGDRITAADVLKMTGRNVSEKEMIFWWQGDAQFVAFLSKQRLVLGLDLPTEIKETLPDFSSERPSRVTPVLWDVVSRLSETSQLRVILKYQGPKEEISDLQPLDSFEKLREGKSTTIALLELNQLEILSLAARDQVVQISLD